MTMIAHVSNACVSDTLENTKSNRAAIKVAPSCCRLVMSNNKTKVFRTENLGFMLLLVL